MEQGLFVKLVNGELEFAEHICEINGEKVIFPTADQYKIIGFKPLIDVNNLPPKDGFTVHFMGYEEKEDSVNAIYDYVKNPPRNLELSKRILMNHLKDIKLENNTTMWDVVKQWMIDNDKWDDWLMATTLMEQDPMMQEAIAVLPSLGLTPEQIETILTNSIIY